MSRVTKIHSVTPRRQADLAAQLSKQNTIIRFLMQLDQLGLNGASTVMSYQKFLLILAYLTLKFYYRDRVKIEWLS